MTTKDLSTLTRYDPDCYGLMLEDPTGEFIRHEDAEQTILALTARVKALESAISSALARADEQGNERWNDIEPTFEAIAMLRKARATLAKGGEVGG